MSEIIKSLQSLVVILGAFGSGKTELALNLVLARAKTDVDGTEDSLLIDLDIVNPYFRSSSQRAALEAVGVRLVSPRFAMSGVDIPSLTPEVMQAFEVGARAVVDVGGDEIGATALGRYHDKLSKLSFDALFVVNALRPMTNTPEGVLAVLERVKAKARIAPTMLVNNTNLQDGTTLEDVLKGEALLAEVSAQCGIPVGMTVCREALLNSLPEHLRKNAFAVTRHLRPEWETP